MIVLWCVFFCNCRKKDSLSPDVVIHQPFNQQVFMYGDVIPVKVMAQDDNQLQFVKVQIENSAGQVVLHGLVNSNPGNNSVVLQGEISFDDIHLPSGNYYVRATASDGENEHVEFTEIILNGAPYELKKVLLVRDIADGITQLDSITSSGEWMNAANVSVTYDAGAVNQYHQYITLAGKDFEGIENLEAQYFFPLSHIDTPYDLSTNYVEDIFYDADSYKTFISAKDGNIFSLDQDGNILSTWTVDETFSAKKLLVTADYLFCYEENNNGLQKKITTYSKQTGVLIQAIGLNGEVIDLVQNGSQNEILVVMNNNDESDFKLYEFDSNSLTDLDFMTTINSSPASAVEYRDGAQVYIAHENGIQLYNNLQASGSGIPITGVIAMKYEKKGNTLYVLTPDELHILNDQASVEIVSFAVPADALDIFLLYNK